MKSTQMRTRLAVVTGGVASLAIAASLLVPVVASAQDATPTTPGTPPAAQAQMRMQNRLGDGDEALATALGITVEELSAAQESAGNAALDAAVEAGLITETQAERMRLMGSGRGMPLFAGADSEIDPDALLADALGISADDLAAARESVYSENLAAAVEEGTITQEQADLMTAGRALRDFVAPRLEQAHTDAVAAAVEEGIITQEQADQLELLSPGRGGFGPMFGDGPMGDGFGRGGMHDGGRGMHGDGMFGDMMGGMFGGEGMRGGRGMHDGMNNGGMWSDDGMQNGPGGRYGQSDQSDSGDSDSDDNY